MTRPYQRTTYLRHTPSFLSLVGCLPTTSNLGKLDFLHTKPLLCSVDHLGDTSLLEVSLGYELHDQVIPEVVLQLSSGLRSHRNLLLTKHY